MAVHTLSKTVPVGFGQGRGSNTIALLRADAADWAEIPSHVEQWAPEQGLSPWELDSGSGFLFGAAQAGYDLLWRSWRMDESPKQVVESLVDFDAVIVPAPYDENMPAVRMLLDAGVPVVLAYSQMDDPRVCWVACDNRSAVTEAVRHLVCLGHSRIGYLGGPRNVADFRDRERGYIDGMVNDGLKVSPDWVAITGLQRTASEIKMAAKRVLSGRDRPSAVVCAEDALAIGLMETAWEMDLRIPEDVAVVGLDDTPEVFELIPHLTSIRQPTVEIANHACYLAACCVAGEQPVFDAWQVELPTTLMIRESCGGARGQYLELPDGPGETNGSHTIRQELEWRMRQLSAMNQEMQDLLHVASHDLRAPLVTIQGFASSLQRKYGERLDDGGRHYLKRIGCSVDNMRMLIESLLTLSRAHSRPLKLSPVHVRSVIVRAVSDLKALASAKGTRFRVPSRMPTVLADETALYQVFLNLVTNALKYMGEQPEPFISVSYQAYPTEYEFTVQDNGMGIAPENHAEVFQAFRRLGPTDSEGSGIGLSTVKRIILRHGGRVWVDSQLGQGAAFRFTLPRREVSHDGDQDHEKDA